MKKAALHNLGCKVNAYETEAMQQLLEAAGYEIVPFTGKADVYVINTCSVTNIADRKSRQMLHRAKKLNPDAVVVAAGCYVQTQEAAVRADSAVDIVIGNDQKSELIGRLEAYFAGKKESAPLADLSRNPCYEKLSLSRTAEHTRAFLKVQDGCNQFCSYCLIPYARGRVRSRDSEDVLREVKRLAAQGYREIVLTGIHLSSYGADQGTDLLSLIRLLHPVEGISRIRLGSLEPRIVTEEFAEALSGMEKICPHFHLSLQSGCNGTLRRMNRRYTTEEYADACARLRRYFTHPAITTDVIVGFPGETDEEFAATVSFLERIRFYEMHIFKYSRRKGTVADTMDGQVPEPVKARRSAELIALSERMSADFCSYYEGKEEEALFEEKVTINGKTFYTGCTREYIKVAAESGVPLENTLAKGRIAERLTQELYRIQL